IVEENIISLIATTHDVIYGAGILDSHLQSCAPIAGGSTLDFTFVSMTRSFHSGSFLRSDPIEARAGRTAGL
ncbi:MAG TPA: hypothetical protein VN673_04550, partial [Clostridia bacterium]|nr:hypothetical protein [Clostridia bacterium]